MTVVSILRSIAANATNPLKTDTSLELSRPALESVFRGQLDEAIQSWVKGQTKEIKQGSTSNDEAREPDATKDDSLQLPILVAFAAVILPAELPASFGLPTAGLEPGSNSDGASPADAIPNAELTATVPDNKPAPPAADARAGPQADLAFALRLGSPAPQDTTRVEQARTAAQSGPVRQTTPAKYLPADPTPVQPSAASAEAVSPEALQQTSSGVPSAGTIQPHRAATATPLVSRIVRQDAMAAESEPDQSSYSASHKEPPPPSPTSTPRPTTARTPPELELKPHEPGAMPSPPDAAHKEIPMQTPGPPHAAAVSVSSASMPEPPVGVAIAPAAPAAVRSHPGPEVTSVSVTLPVPRADSTGEDRVAIRMVQKGAEIHVSVRTPDNQLSQNLRQDLGKLASGLDQAGFHTETWRPLVSVTAALSPSSASQESSQREPNRDNPGPDARSGGHQGHNPGEQKRRQQDQRPRWVAELEQYKNQ